MEKIPVENTLDQYYGYNFEYHVLKVHPFGDVKITVCRECHALVWDCESHYHWHKDLDAELNERDRWVKV